MAGSEDRDDDPIERAMRRKAASDKAAAKPVMAAPKKADARSEPSIAKPAKPASDSYLPPDRSFFAPTAEERAEQARRAAQRVRRRAKGQDLDAGEAAAKKAPGNAAPAPQKAPRGDSPSPPAPAAKSILDRAADAAAKPPKKPVLTKAERRLAQKTEPIPVAPEPAKPSVEDVISGAATAAGAAKKAVKPTADIVTRATTRDSAKPVEAAKPIPKPVSAPPPAAPVAKKKAVSTPKPATPPRVGTPPAPAPDAPKADAAQKLTASPVETVAAPQDDSIYAQDVAVPPASAIRSAKTRAFAPFEWMIASRYLRARKKEGFVSVIAGFSLVGIALGVATLIVVMAVMTGFRETLITQIIGGSPHVNVTSQIGPFQNYDTVADQIRSVDGIDYVTPVVQGQVLATGNQRHSGVVVRGMRKADLENLLTTAEPEIINGSLADFTEDRGVALGANLAAKLGLRVGDFITLISPDGDITPFQATPMPRVKDYKVIQTFRLGVQEIDYNVAFMPFEEAQIYFNKQGQADTLDVFVADAQNVETYTGPILQASRSSISLFNWKTSNGRLIGAINLERQVMFVILTMIILVAALNIISGLVMLVKDKARDVAIMRTMGMARGSILRIFFICGSSIGVIGSLLGVFLGVMFVWNIHAIQGFVEWVTGTQVWDPSVRAGITEIPTNLQLSDVALTLFIALGLSFIATLFPAWKAAKLDPVEALRYE